MRICLVTEHFHPQVGGIERHVAGLGKGLADLGHEIMVVTTTPGPKQVEGIPVKRFRVPLVPVVKIPFSPFGILPLEDLLGGEDFDLVHCHHSVVSPGVACAAYLAQRRGIPTVVTFHSILDGYTPAFRLLDGLSGWSRWPVVFSAVSSAVAAGLQPVWPDREIPILPNGFDAEFWKPASEKPRAQGEMTLVSTLRLAPRKRPLALVKILARLREALPRGYPFRLRIIGEGPERRKVEKAIASKGLGGRIELTGELSPAAIRQAYEEAHIFVLPSREESFGLAVLEARSAGLPVVARGGRGLAEFIQEGVNGLLASSDEEVLSSLLRLIRDDDLREAMTRTNRTTQPPLSWPQVLESHMAAYAEARRLSAQGRSDPE